MSDTPRTDAAAWKGSDLGLANAWASGIWNLARTLERELSAVTRERDDAYANVEDADRELKALRAEVERLRDALDTLTLVVGLTPIAGNKDALQQAVDVARAALQEQKCTTN